MMAAAQPVDLPNDQNLAPRAPRRLVRDDVIDLATGQGRLTLQAMQLPVARGDQLVDCTVRAKGVCTSLFNAQRQLFDVSLLVPFPEDLLIDRPAPSHPGLIPEQPIKSVMQFTRAST